MAFPNPFKKEAKEDFSDFGKLGNEGLSQSSAPSHFGLPLDDAAYTAHPSEYARQDHFSPGNTDAAFSAMPTQSSASSLATSHDDFAPSMNSNRPDAISELSRLRQSAPQPTHHGSSEDSNRIISLDKDMQIINAKLDAIKSFMESINQRLMHIERIAEDSKPKEERIRW